MAVSSRGLAGCGGGCRNDAGGDLGHDVLHREGGAAVVEQGLGEEVSLR